ncbi:hypothetical protein PR202_ga02249 [Eleusine coracana subsp. coracana]|uniref:Uncharacterized protein n=1 Tax=Eleusine coracana subsp. coracana TaxID=191504 RepID=A0AAV5BL56_ELECO|nr:hypothetical protein QOZ80_2AG0140260 [Eleusine coracana subsp. coracana]GJM86395.1 hypothetical protein PR202_ga02249 [Eleusine coracana subsp. coracana]
MELEAAAPVPTRRDGRKLARCPRLQLDTKTVSAIQQSTGETIDVEATDAAGGAMRVKIVLSKQQLKQVAAAVAGGGSFSLPPALEQLVSVLKRQHAKKQAAAAAAEEVAIARRRGRWSPALQSIPEECFS